MTPPRPTLPPFVLLLAVLLLAGCVPPQGQRAPAVSERFAGMPAHASVLVAYPESLEGFEFRRVEAYPEPENGTALRYASGTFPDMRIDAFVFFVGFSEDPEPVITEFEATFDAYMDNAIDAGAFRAWRPVDSGRTRITYPFGERTGLWWLFDFDLVEPEMTLASVTQLHYRAPFAIRIRASHPPTVDGAELAANVDDFAGKLLPELTIRLARGCDGALNVHVREGGDARAMALALGEALLEAGKRGCSDYDAARMGVERLRAEIDDGEATP